MSDIFCQDCNFFVVTKDPEWVTGDYIDWGQTICTKHYIQRDFMGAADIRRMKCVEEEKKPEPFSLLKLNEKFRDICERIMRWVGKEQ